MTHKLFGRLWVFLAILSLVGIACNFTRLVSQPKATPIPVTTQAVLGLQQDLEAAATQLMSGQPVTLVIDESELTSLVALEMQNQSPPVLTDPQIRLRDGQMQISGKVTQAGLSLDLEMALRLSAKPDGTLDYQVASASLGGISLSQGMLDNLSQQLDVVLKDQIDPRVEMVFIQNLSIADGKLTLQGYKR